MATDARVLNAVEAAAFLGVHVETLRKLARRNDVPCFKVGRDWRFREEALVGWADEQRATDRGESLPILQNGIEANPAIAGQNTHELSIADSLDAVRRHAAARGRHVGNTRGDDEDHDLAAEVVSFARSSDNLRSLLQAATRCLQKWLGCDAVGVRLREGLDFPYYETRGFPPEFVDAERSLCARDAMNELLRDSDGNPVLECMCGNVICGRFDVSKPFFTEQGSFWSNNTTELLASTTEEDRLARTRNRCNGEGYESVALIPLKLETEIVGLLQISDRREGFFSGEVIALLERVAESMASVVLQDDALRSRQENDVPVGSRLDSRKAVVVAGRSVVPAESSPSGVAETTVLELAVDSATHRILTIACEGLPKLGQEMLASLLEGRLLPGALREAKEGMTNGYYSGLRKPVIAALEDALRNYRELSKGARDAHESKTGSVLVIDDEEKVCQALSRHVERLGCRARYATSGATGLELVAEEVPDLILLDLKMPGMNGPEFLEELRKTHPDLPVVIVTGFPDGDLMHEATRYPPLMLLPKPVDREQLERTVRIVLGERTAALRTG